MDSRLNLLRANQRNSHIESYARMYCAALPVADILVSLKGAGQDTKSNHGQVFDTGVEYCLD